MTAVTPERGEGLNPEDEFFEVFESYRPAPSPATDEVVEVLREIEGVADVCGDVDWMTALSGLARITTCARSLLAKLEVRG